MTNQELKQAYEAMIAKNAARNRELRPFTASDYEAFSGAEDLLASPPLIGYIGDTYTLVVSGVDENSRAAVLIADGQTTWTHDFNHDSSALAVARAALLLNDDDIVDFLMDFHFEAN